MKTDRCYHTQNDSCDADCMHQDSPIRENWEEPLDTILDVAFGKGIELMVTDGKPPIRERIKNLFRQTIASENQALRGRILSKVNEFEMKVIRANVHKEYRIGVADTTDEVRAVIEDTV